MIVVALLENVRGKEVHHLERVRSLSRVSLHPSFKARVLAPCSILARTQTKRKLDQIIRRLETDPALGKPLRGSLLGAREGCGDSRSHLARAHMSSR